MPFRKSAKGLKVRGKYDDVKSVKSLSARSNDAGVGIEAAGMEEASGHDAAPVDSGSQRIGPVKRSATDSKRTSTQRNLNVAANSASAQPSGHGSPLLESRDTVGFRRRTTRQTTHKPELAADLSGRNTAGALPPGGQVRQERPLSKVTRSSKVDDSQQATLTPARARAKRMSQPVAKTRGTILPRLAEKLDVTVRSGAAGSSRSKPKDAQTKAREIPSPGGPALVAKRSPKPTSVLSAAEQKKAAPSGVPSAPSTNRSGRRGPVKHSFDAPKLRERAGPVAPPQKRAARTSAQPKPHSLPTRGAGRTRVLSGSDKGLNTKEKLAKGEVTKAATQQTKTAVGSRFANQEEMPIRRREAPLDTDEASSDASSYMVPRIVLQPYRCKDRFFDDCVKPWQEEEYFWSDSESEDCSNASISSIIPPPGLLQPYRKKQRLIGTSSEESLSRSDADYEEEEDLSARCHRIFGMDTLPNSTTTKAEAISMLVSFVSSRKLPWGALAELVTLVNKLYAPAKNVLPDSKALENMLSLMP